jgi:hypothetical protein
MIVPTMLCLLAVATGAATAAKPASSAGLAGTTWHTVRVEGDALFFFVKEIGIRFENSGRFVAAVRFIDGQQKSRSGTYRLTAPGTLLVTIDGSETPKQVKFRRRGADLIVQDTAFGVTAKMVRGKIEEEHWF